MNSPKKPARPTPEPASEPEVVSRAKLKQFAAFHNMRISGDFATVLNNQLVAIIHRAIVACRKRGAQSLQPRDIVP